MNDTISRRAAIRWVKTECNPYGNPTLDFESGKKVIEHLKQMPSVQPEIIRCKDCKWNNGENYCLNDGTFFELCADDAYCSFGERRTDG